MFLINKKQNKACSFPDKGGGSHRIYFNNKRTKTERYSKGRYMTVEQTYQRLISFGYENCTEEEFNNYFIKNYETNTSN